MTFDPISYSLAKRKSAGGVVYSSSEPSDKSVVWFDTNTRKPKIYDNQKGEWGRLGYYIGYPYFDNNVGGGWPNYVNIPITTSPSESVQYKIEINGDNINVYSNDGTTVLTTGTGGLYFWRAIQTDGKDIRVFDETYSQNYFWVEKFDYANQNAVIWVKLNAGQEEVNIAYGNDDCLVSDYNDGNMTFEFFDDFSSGSLNGWKILQDNSSCTASVVQYDGKYMAKLYATEDDANSVGIAYPFAASNKGYIIETYAITDTIVDGVYTGFTDGTIVSSKWGFPQNGYLFAFARGLNTWSGIQVIQNSAEINSTKADTQFNTNTYYVCSGLWYSNTLENYINYSKTASLTDSTFSNFDYIYVSVDKGTWYFDWVRVRKYLPSDLSFGTPTIKEF